MMARRTSAPAANITRNQKLKVPIKEPKRKLSSNPILCVTDMPGLSARKGAGHPDTSRGSQFSCSGPSKPYIAFSSVAGLIQAVPSEIANAKTNGAIIFDIAELWIRSSSAASGVC